MTLMQEIGIDIAFVIAGFLIGCIVTYFIARDDARIEMQNPSRRKLRRAERALQKSGLSEIESELVLQAVGNILLGDNPYPENEIRRRNQVRQRQMERDEEQRSQEEVAEMLGAILECIYGDEDED